MKSDKLLSLIGALIIPAPLMITSLASVYKDNLFLPILIWWIGGAFVLLLGHFVGSRVKKAGKKTVWIVKIAVGVSGTLSVIASLVFVYLAEMTSLAYMFMPAAVVFWYWFGYRSGLERELITNSVLLVYCLEAVFLFPMCNSVSENSVSGNIVIVISAAVLVISAVLINRRQLVKMSARGKNTIAVMSKDTRRFNLKLTLIFSAIILVPFLFAHWGGKLLFEVFKAFVKFLLSLFINMSDDPDTMIIEDSGKKLLEITQNDTLWLQVLLSVIVGILFIILFAKPVIRAVKKLIRSIKQKLGRLYNGSSRELAYVDFYEVIDVKKQSISSFKKAYKSFLKEKELNRKYRLGYKAFMIRLKELGEENFPSDTTTVHRKKGSRVIDRDVIDSVIDQYEQLRYYDGAVTSEDCTQMELMLKSLY